MELVIPAGAIAALFGKKGLFLKEIFLVVKNLECMVPIINHCSCYASLSVRVFLASAFGECIMIKSFVSGLKIHSLLEAFFLCKYLLISDELSSSLPAETAH